MQPLVSKNAPQALVVSEVFRNNQARTEYSLAEHTSEWCEALASPVEGTLQTEELESLLTDLRLKLLPRATTCHCVHRSRAS